MPHDLAHTLSQHCSLQHSAHHAQASVGRISAASCAVATLQRNCGLARSGSGGAAAAPQLATTCCPSPKRASPPTQSPERHHPHPNARSRRTHHAPHAYVRRTGRPRHAIGPRRRRPRPRRLVRTRAITPHGRAAINPSGAPINSMGTASRSTGGTATPPTTAAARHAALPRRPPPPPIPQTNRPRPPRHPSPMTRTATHPPA